MEVKLYLLELLMYYINIRNRILLKIRRKIKKYQNTFTNCNCISIRYVYILDFVSRKIKKTVNSSYYKMDKKIRESVNQYFSKCNYYYCGTRPTHLNVFYDGYNGGWVTKCDNGHKSLNTYSKSLARSVHNWKLLNRLTYTINQGINSEL